MNIFQNTVIKLTRKRIREEYEAFKKEVGGDFKDFFEIVEEETPDGFIIDFKEKDKEACARWDAGIDKLRSFKEIKREVAAELRKGPKL